MVKWEYSVVYFNHQLEDLVEHLNRYGSEGWEVVILEYNEGACRGSHDTRALLKRIVDMNNHTPGSRKAPEEPVED